MAVRLAATLGATTLLTIGALAVGAATSNSNQPPTTRRAGEPRDQERDSDVDGNVDGENTKDEEPSTTSQAPLDTSQNNEVSPDPVRAEQCFFEINDGNYRNGTVKFETKEGKNQGFKMTATVDLDSARKLDSSLKHFHGCKYFDSKNDSAQLSFCITAQPPSKFGPVKVSRDDPERGKFTVKNFKVPEGDTTVFGSNEIRYCQDHATDRDDGHKADDPPDPSEDPIGSSDTNVDRPG